MSFWLRLAINAAAIWLATVLLSGLTVVAGEGTGSTVLVLLVVVGVVRRNIVEFDDVVLGSIRPVIDELLDRRKVGSEERSRS